MPIQEQNIVFVESQVMDDVPEGGGAATGRVIADGQMNNVFPDISDLDRAYGRFNLRKIFVAVRTASTDLFGGARSLITELPEDDALGYTLFTTSDPFDQRADASGRVEAYLGASTEWSGYLLENHISGQRSIQIFQRPGATPPDPGETMVLVEGEGGASEKRQYVRATRVTVETRQFTQVGGSSGYLDYDAEVVTIEISDPLRYDFSGSPPSRLFTRSPAAAKIRGTLVTDATRYYGASPLSAAAGVGDYDVRVASMWARLVPSSQTEIPLVDRLLAGDATPIVRASAGDIAYNTSLTLAPGASITLPTPCWPGSLSIALGAHSLTDDGLGIVKYNGVGVGAIAYGTGQITLSAGTPYTSGSVSITYGPAAPVQLPSHTTLRPVTAANRSYVWVVPLSPQPSPGSIEIAYQAQGRWYTLRDNGQGAIAGSDSSYGSGSVNYGTGTVNVTLGALPDAGSAIMFAWGTPAEYIPMTQPELGIQAPLVDYTLASGNCEPGTLSISWDSGGSTVTATDDGEGNITGAATGQIYYGTGRLYFRPTVIPSSGAQYQISYDSAHPDDIVDQMASGVVSGIAYTTTLPNAPIRPGSVLIDLMIAQTATDSTGEGAAVSTTNTLPAQVRDDRAGGLVLASSGGNYPLTGSSINYSTGELVISLNRQTYAPVKQYQMVETEKFIASAG